MSEPTTPTPPPIQPGAEVVVDNVRAQLAAQPWYRTFSNTVTTAIGSIFTIMWVVSSQGFEIPAQVTIPVYVVLALAVVFGVYKTKNGVSPSQVEELERWSRSTLGLDRRP